MNILIVGCGTVGMATGKGFLRFGHSVMFHDKSQVRLDELKAMGFSISLRKIGIPTCSDVIFICTPEDAVEQVIDEIVEKRVEGLKVIRSTVPPTTTRRLEVKTAMHNHICHNPEFLREGVADYEFMNPQRIVIGECCQKHGDLLEKLYEPFRAPIIRVDPTTSEMLKLASNTYLATLISFWNEINLICEKVGVNSHVVGKVASLDPRISIYGSSLHGKSFGGRCLPKDLDNFIGFCEEKGLNPVLLKAVKEVNER